MVGTTYPWHIRNDPYDVGRFTSFEEQIRRFDWQSWESMIEAAKRAREEAKSYRNFQVGCAIWAVNTHAASVRYCMNVFTGGNVKVAEDTRPVCAEQFALGAVRSAGYDKVIAMVVVGLSQNDVASGLMPITLHPCEECLRVFQTSPEFLPETQILTITPDESVYEQFTLRELLALHERNCDTGKCGET